MSDHGPVDVDDLADRLIEKRERLHYFIVTASAAAIAFSLGSLQPPGPTIPAGKKMIAELAGIVLLLAAAIALAGIFYRHKVYSEYLDAKARRTQVGENRRNFIRKAFAWLEGAMIFLFYVGFAALAWVDAAVLLVGPSGGGGGK